MQPALPLPTDNIYKFSCLFGLALIVSSIFSFVAVYNSSLEQKVRHAVVAIPLESIQQQTKVEKDLLALHKKLIQITSENEKSAAFVIGFLMTAGFFLSGLGAYKWHGVIQVRDNKLAELQLRKLEIEVAKLEKENTPEGLKTDG